MPVRRPISAAPFAGSTRPHAAPVRLRYALLVIDETPLRGAAWAELHAARKRLEKAARDLHRHEEVDVPAYASWMHRTFPGAMTTLRELQREIDEKGWQVEMVQEMAFLTGRSAKKLWRERQAAKTAPDDAGPDGDERGAPGQDADRGEADDDFFREDENPRGSRRGRSEDAFDPWAAPRPTPPPNSAARDIYRRLVQHLHPDRGGAWTPARERLWHEVQQAWAAADADWLSRLEAEWDSANEILGPTSPLSRMRRAIAELLSGRRDLERKLRAYRSAPAWRFTLTERKRAQLQRQIEENIEHDLAILERHRDHLNATIAAWEAPPRRRRDRAAAWSADEL